MELNEHEFESNDFKWPRYCPHCDKIQPQHYHFCVFCLRDSVSKYFWDGWNDTKRQDFMKYHENKEVPNPSMVNMEKIEQMRKKAERFEIAYREHLAEEQYRKEHPVVYTPKCPTCGCPDLEKIGAGEKAVSAAMFGLFSKKIHKQFRCKNCGYEW